MTGRRVRRGEKWSMIEVKKEKKRIHRDETKGTKGGGRKHGR